MPASGGSVSDNTVPKTQDVQGKEHFLAYITPDEGKTLEQTGSVIESTPQGIPSYGGHRGGAEKTAAAGGVGAQGEGPVVDRELGDVKETYMLPRDVTSEYTSGPTETTETKDSLVTKFKQGLVDNKYVKSVISKMGWVTDNSLMNALGGAVGVIGMLGTEAQSKAINWELNRRLQKEFKIEDDPRYRTGKSDIIQERIRRANLDPDDPEHYGQTDYMKDYPGQPPAPEEGDNARGLTNIITPYAAHAIGGTTQQPSMAANWYANLGSGNTNPGAFNLTQQYAAAKASVSQRLKSTSSIGQIAVSDSAFFNFLKDNSLNKGIL